MTLSVERPEEKDQVCECKLGISQQQTQIRFMAAFYNMDNKQDYTFYEKGFYINMKVQVEFGFEYSKMHCKMFYNRNTETMVVLFTKSHFDINENEFYFLENQMVKERTSFDVSIRSVKNSQLLAECKFTRDSAPKSKITKLRYIFVDASFQQELSEYYVAPRSNEQRDLLRIKNDVQFDCLPNISIEQDPDN